VRHFSQKYRILFFFSFFSIFLDQISKAWILQHFRLNQSVILLDGFFNLTYVRNTGAAFSLLANANDAIRIPFFFFVPFLALGFIFSSYRKLTEKEVLASIAYALVTGGAIGNLIDRLRFGYVIDFFDFYWGIYHYPVFNIADSVICIGVGLLFFQSFRHRNDQIKY
jgi:signal peptidase II